MMLITTILELEESLVNWMEFHKSDIIYGDSTDNGMPFDNFTTVLFNDTWKVLWRFLW